MVFCIEAENKLNKRTNISFIGDDEALAKALKANQPGAKEALYNRYAAHIRGVLVRTLGSNVDLQDHLHNVFIEAFLGTKTIRDGKKLKAWLTRVAVFTAIAYIRKRGRRKWLIYSEPEQLPEVPVSQVNSETIESLSKVYEILDKFSAKERVPFCLRVIDGMPLQDVADACDVSLATIKRRITKSKSRFIKLARNEPSLWEILKEDESWRSV